MKRFMRLGIAALLFVALGAVFAAAAQATTYTYLELGFSEEPEIGKSIPFTVIVKSSKPDNQIAGIARATWTDLTDGSRELTKSDKFKKDHTYRVEIRYECIVPCDISKDAVIWINGNAADWDKARSMWANQSLTAYRDVVVYCNITMSAQVITSVRLPDLPQVVAGEHPPYLQSGSYRDENNHCHINYGRTDLNSYYRGAEAWFDETDRIWLDELDTFQAGHTYRYYVAVSADSGYVFDSEEDVFLKVSARTLSGQEKYAHEIIKADSRGVTDFAAGFLIPCKSVVSSVSVTGITEPAAGVKPDYNAVTNSEYYQILPYTSGNWKNGIRWVDETGNSVLTPDSCFAAGHRYRAEVLVQIRVSNSEFACENGVPAVTGTVNGNTATIWNAYPDDCQHKIGLQYTFSKIPEPEMKGITNVTVSGVTLPLAGQKPTYHAEVPSGANYKIENYNDGNAWQNGVSWEDVTAEETLLPSDTFQSGHVYQVSVSLVPKSDGYMFPKNEVSGTVNGLNADYFNWISNTNILMNASFKCEEKVVHFISVDFIEPVAGQEPDWNMTANGEGYDVETDYSDSKYINGIYWQDVTDNLVMKKGDRFVAGHTYTVTVSLVTDYGWEFGDYQKNGLTSYLGGVHPDDTIDWNDPQNNIGLVRTFTVAARLPGDANADGKVDMKDALTVVQYLKGKASAISLGNADVTGDGKAAIEDARLIGQYAAGWNVGLK